MNKDNAKDYLPLVQALIDGKTIQYHFDASKWVDSKELDTTYSIACWRIKPEPQDFWITDCPTIDHKLVAFREQPKNGCEKCKIIHVREVID